MSFCFEPSDIRITGTHPLPRPTEHLPGTPEKVSVLEERAALGLALYHPNDFGVTGKEWNNYSYPMVPNRIDRLVISKQAIPLWQTIKMVGRRVNYRSSWRPGDEPLPGDYWSDEYGNWGGFCPTGHYYEFKKGTVTEHEDRTITVTQSIILCSHYGAIDGDGAYVEHWHGYLKRGVWKAV
jgi:hypothetical protein